MKTLFRYFLIPFAIIHIRIIQYRYKKITTGNYHNQTNSNLAKLKLLQSKEYYYKRQFDSWGKFHPKFSYSSEGLKKHYEYLKWLFPKKDFKEWDVVIWYKPEAVTYYQNLIYKLQDGKGRLYEIEIPKQIEEWEKEKEED